MPRLCGRWGIADALLSPISPDRPSTVVFATRMNGPLIARFDAECGSRVREPSLLGRSAMGADLEEVLRQCAHEFPVSRSISRWNLWR